MWFFYIAFEEIGAIRTGALISTSALFGVAIAFAYFGASAAPSAVQLGGGLLMVAGTFLTIEPGRPAKG
jgi:drug/metabolite transporter (DMT)-like permease